MHVLSPEGVYSLVNDVARFRGISDVSAEEVADLVSAISQSVMKYLIKKGYLDKDGEVVLNPMADDLFTESASLALATSCSICGKIAFGPNAGKYVRRIGSGFGYEGEIPLLKGPRCYMVNGFSLHANTKVNTHRRDRLKELIEYIARGPLSNERLEITKEGDVKLRLKTRYSDGTTHLLFSPEEFLEKLSALIPPPRTHLVRWGGVFAPASPFRKQIVVRPEVKKGFQFAEEGEKGKKKNRSWSKMLSKVFGIDVLKCPKCSGGMKPMAAITDSYEIRRYLKHAGLDYDPPERSPPRRVQQSLDFQQPPEDEEDVIYID